VASERRSTASPRETLPLRPGLVRRVAGGVYAVELADGELVEAALRGRLKQEARTGDSVVAGDRVQICMHGDGSVTIEEVEERSSELARRAPGHGGRRAKVIVANIDRIIVVFAAAYPEPRLRMLDRFLVLAEADSLPVAIVVNKVELTGEDAARELFADYHAAGYSILYTSVKQGGVGLAALRSALCGSTSVLTGPSGVGKSSLLNSIQPGLGLRIGDVSETVGKGRHTTSAAELIALDCGGYVADTPGLRELGLWQVEPERLPFCFPEFQPYLGECRFSTCTHTHEPACAVQAAVEAGSVSRARYESYLALRSGEEADQREW
jgi:ribosome biogenesis GTPase / thiamine phosphate phosphatase